MDWALDNLRIDLLRAENHPVRPRRWNGAYPPDPFHRIYLIEAGNCRIAHHARHWELGPGDAFLIPANAPHELFTPHGATIRYTHCLATVLGGLSLFDYAPARYYFRPQDPETLRQPLRQLHHELQAAPPSLARRLRIRSALEQLLAHFLADDTQAPAPPTPQLLRLRPALERIENQIATPPRVDELARQLHLQRSHFSRLFRNTLGLSPKQYIQQRRITRARQLLLTTNQSLEQIAAATGFHDAFHLSKTFKTQTHQTPTECRHENNTPRP